MSRKLFDLFDALLAERETQAHRDMHERVAEQFVQQDGIERTRMLSDFLLGADSVLPWLNEDNMYNSARCALRVHERSRQVCSFVRMQPQLVIQGKEDAQCFGCLASLEDVSQRTHARSGDILWEMKHFALYQEAVLIFATTTPFVFAVHDMCPAAFSGWEVHKFAENYNTRQYRLDDNREKLEPRVVPDRFLLVTDTLTLQHACHELCLCAECLHVALTLMSERGEMRGVLKEAVKIYLENMRYGWEFRERTWRENVEDRREKCLFRSTRPSASLHAVNVLFEFQSDDFPVGRVWTPEERERALWLAEVRAEARAEEEGHAFFPFHRVEGAENLREALKRVGGVGGSTEWLKKEQN